MQNTSLYPLACEQCWVFNMLKSHIRSIFKFMCFGGFTIHSIDACLRVNHHLRHSKITKLKQAYPGDT